MRILCRSSVGPSSVARHGRIDEQRPGVDAAAEVVEIPESLAPEVLGRVLAADAVVALEHDGRIPIAEEQRIVIRLVEQARAVDRGDRALLLGADVDQLDCGAALEQCLQIRRRQLTNRREARVPWCSGPLIVDSRLPNRVWSIRRR